MRLLKNGRKIQHMIKEIETQLGSLRRYVNEVEIDTTNLARALNHPKATVVWETPKTTENTSMYTNWDVNKGCYVTTKDINHTGSKALTADIAHPKTRTYNRKKTTTNSRNTVSFAQQVRNVFADGKPYTNKDVAYRLNTTPIKAGVMLAHLKNAGELRRIGTGRYQKS